MTNERNICLINDSFPPLIDGVVNAVVNYGKYINEQHGKATVVTPYHPDADDSVFPYPVLRYPSLDVTRMVGYRAGMPFQPELQAKIEQAHFDLIHTHCPITSTMLARTLQPRLQVPVVLTYHTKFDVDIANAIKNRLLQEEATRLLVQNIEACDEVWTVSRGAGENLRSLGYQGEYIVMPNGVDLPKGRVEDELIRDTVKDYDLPEDVPVYLYVGRMMWYKGIRITLDALKQLRDAGQDFRMVFVGGGQDKDEITAYSASLGLSDRVFFSAPVYDRNRIRAWYCRADLFLFPSTFDTNGLVVREAAACGLASVLVRGSCAAEDSTDGEDGYLIEENAASMAELLRTLGGNRTAMAQTGEMAQKNLYMSWEESVSRAWERYGVVIEKYKAGEYREHKELSDEFFRALSNGMADVTKMRQKRRIRLEELIAELGEMRSDMQYGRMQTLAHMENLRQDAALGLSELKTEFRDALEELLQHMDRFQ